MVISPLASSMNYKESSIKIYMAPNSRRKKRHKSNCRQQYQFTISIFSNIPKKHIFYWLSVLYLLLEFLSMIITFIYHLSIN